MGRSSWSAVRLVADATIDAASAAAAYSAEVLHELCFSSIASLLFHGCTGSLPAATRPASGGAVDA